MISFLSATTAGVVQFVVGQPLDYLIVKYQTSLKSNENKLKPFIQKIYQEGGWKAFYKGGASVLGSLPFIIGFKFTIFEKLNEARI